MNCGSLTEDDTWLPKRSSGEYEQNNEWRMTCWGKVGRGNYPPTIWFRPETTRWSHLSGWFPVDCRYVRDKRKGKTHPLRDTQVGHNCPPLMHNGIYVFRQSRQLRVTRLKTVLFSVLISTYVLLLQCIYYFSECISLLFSGYICYVLFSEMFYNFNYLRNFFSVCLCSYTGFYFSHDPLDPILVTL